MYLKNGIRHQRPCSGCDLFVSVVFCVMEHSSCCLFCGVLPPPPGLPEATEVQGCSAGHELGGRR